MRKGNYITTDEQPMVKQGFWLIRSSDNARFYISEEVNTLALERVCSRLLNDKTGYDYWIDYCLGYDVKGSAAWSNVDHTESFI